MAATQSHPRTTTRTEPAPGPDALKMLKAEHREVDAWFKEFEKTTNGSRKHKLAKQICTALRLHTQIEEEIFYPACREVGLEPDMMDEADVEHDAAKKLIKEIEGGKPGDDHWSAKVKVLGEMIRHHVKEEEGLGGIFAKARRSDLDLDDLGARMKARKEALIKQMKKRN
ncbi:hemerythrin domain-containing protein [Candidatus Viadribacter manganicus]|uniref:Hemerythrin-like domain-containing protein n=1 Tax=Candidatus Viadribacter manganicus TaxID=1759059 RepID=A0A1B1AKI2_9PROT|nr:hemerythrin domain-containing protein [Candidatus Viadribacter manganicus]ANP47051.1 hypothetical protein ATE48_14575 [Candidatus Viadribacter manganicus]